jgi:hypothetical protein
MDGADWCQMFRDRHRPDAVCMLDSLALGRTHQRPAGSFGEDISAFSSAYALPLFAYPQTGVGPRSLLRIADRIPSDLAGQKGVHEHLDAIPAREKHSCNNRNSNATAGRLVLACEIVPTKTSSKLAGSGNWNATSNAKMSIPCSPCAMLFATVVGAKCGKRRSSPAFPGAVVVIGVTKAGHQLSIDFSSS